MARTKFNVRRTVDGAAKQPRKKIMGKKPAAAVAVATKVRPPRPPRDDDGDDDQSASTVQEQAADNGGGGGGGAAAAVSASKRRKAGKTPAAKLGGVRRPHRFRPGTVALREIRRYQRSTDMLLAHAPFRRMLDDIVASFSDGARTQRMTALATSVLREVSQAYVVSLLEKSMRLALHARRVTLLPQDIELAHQLCYPHLRR